MLSKCVARMECDDVGAGYGAFVDMVGRLVHAVRHCGMLRVLLALIDALSRVGAVSWLGALFRIVASTAIERIRVRHHWWKDGVMADVVFVGEGWWSRVLPRKLSKCKYATQ